MSKTRRNTKPPSKEKDPIKPIVSLEGIWSDRGFNVTAEDIAKARDEMWGNFPRDIANVVPKKPTK